MEDRIVPRQILKVTLSLSDGRNLSGTIQIDMDSRLSDFMNISTQFIVFTDRDGGLKIINKNHIIDIRDTESTDEDSSNRKNIT